MDLKLFFPDPGPYPYSTFQIISVPVLDPAFQLISDPPGYGSCSGRILDISYSNSAEIWYPVLTGTYLFDNFHGKIIKPFCVGRNGSTNIFLSNFGKRPGS